ncbi:hypothetical protein FPSE5266_20286 [Fusarium pseudograminearum]|nr:hypothetical protein FPSE5266_20286 [Fusarium pseudograminearum]
MSIIGLWLVAVIATFSLCVWELVFLLSIPKSVVVCLLAESLFFVAWFFYWTVIYPKYLTPFRHLPTPASRSILTGNQNGLFTENSWDVARRVSQTVPNSGLIRYYVAMSNERILVTNTRALSDVLTNHSHDFGKSNLAKFALKRLTGNGLGFLEGNEHKVHRKNLMPAFTRKHVRELTPIFWDKAMEMVKGMEAEVGCGKDTSTQGTGIVKIHDWATRATLDIIGTAGFGYDFGTLHNPSNEIGQQYKKMFLEPSTAFNWLELLGNYIDFRFLMTLPVKKNRDLTAGSNFMREIAKKVIRERRHELFQSKTPQAGNMESTKKDIITTALASDCFTDDQLVDHVMAFLVAGHESTATAFEWAMYELGRRPEMQKRVRDEVRTYLPSPSAGGLKTISFESVPYLQAVCNEVLRLYPFLPFATRVAEKDTWVADQFVPKGTIVAYAAHISNRDSELWSSPALDTFDPERWMESGKESSGGANSNYAMLTFSAGPKSCIGEAWTRAELPCLVGAMVGSFEIELVEGEQADGTVYPTVASKMGKVLKSRDGVFVRLRRLEDW